MGWLRVVPGFKLLLAYDGVQSYSVGKDEFNNLFKDSHLKSLVCYCPACTASHQTIFYKHTTNATDFDAYDAMTCNFTFIHNKFSSDFGV